MKKLLLSLMILISGKLYAGEFIELNMYPSANLFGMYRTGASRISDDTYSFFANPALSSSTLTPNMVSVNYGSGSIINNNPLNSNNFAISWNHKKDKWSYGLGIFHQSLDMGSHPASGELVGDDWVFINEGKNPNHYQTGVNFSSTFGSKFKVGLGLNIKKIYISDENNPNPSEAMFGIDLGIIATYNILENKKISDKMDINLITSVGISKTNIEFDINKTVNSDDRMGYSIQTGLNYSFEKNKIKVLGIDWTSEAVSANDNKEFFNKVVFFKDVFSLNGFNSIGAYKISLMEILSLMKGIVPDISLSTQLYTINYSTTTYGIGVSSTGILKVLNEYFDNKILSWFVNNLGFDYTFGEVSSEFFYHTKADTYEQHTNKYSFRSFQISLKNLDLFGNNRKSAKKKK